MFAKPLRRRKSNSCREYHQTNYLLIQYFMRKIYHFSGLLLGGTANQHITPTLSPRRQKKMTRAIAVWTLAAPLRRPMAASPTSSPADFSTWMTLEVAIGLMKANGGLWQRLNPSTPHIKQKKQELCWWWCQGSMNLVRTGSEALTKPSAEYWFMSFLEVSRCVDSLRLAQSSVEKFAMWSTKVLVWSSCPCTQMDGW